MLLAAKFKDRELQRAWDGPLSPKAFDITKAALVAIADLFSFYEQWMRPKFPPEQTFLAARVQRHCNLTLINPAVDGGNNRLDSLLTPWRQQINIFTLPNLSRVLPTDGFFLDKTPACYLPHDGGHRNNDRSEPSGRNNRRREQEGGSPRQGKKARQPLLTFTERAGAGNRAVKHILESINEGRPDDARISFPIHVRQGQRRSFPICFKFSSSNGPGCSQESCRFHHVDLQNPQSVRDNFDPRFLPAFCDVLEKPEVKPFITATASFRSFLGRR